MEQQCCQKRWIISDEDLISLKHNLARLMSELPAVIFPGGDIYSLMCKDMLQRLGHLVQCPE